MKMFCSSDGSNPAGRTFFVFKLAGFEIKRYDNSGCLLLVHTTQEAQPEGNQSSIYKTHFHKFIMDSLKIKTSNPK